MHIVKKITQDVFWVGATDRKLSLFESVYPIPEGISYNSYLLLDDKTVLLDTVDRAVSGRLLENLSFLLNDRPLDFLIVNHMEPDHCALIDALSRQYPDMQIVINRKSLVMIKQFFDFDIDSRALLVEEGDTLCTGRHTLQFVMAPMVHWPETMVTYDTANKILFSADAFGSFGAMSANLFADEVIMDAGRINEYRRYYANIVGKYGTQVTALLNKAKDLDIQMICPLHGLVWRKQVHILLQKYRQWAAYLPEDNAVMIAYNSVYGNTENCVNLLAGKLAELGAKNIVMYDTAVTHVSYIVAEAFRCSHLVLAATTYNAEIFSSMDALVRDLAAHNLQNRTVALIENGSWAPTACRLMQAQLEKCKNMTFLESTVTIRSAVKEAQRSQLEQLARSIMDSMPQPAILENQAEKIDANVMFKLTYGMYLLSTKDGSRDNGCIINTVTQVTDTPKRISVTVNKANLTQEMILNAGVFNVSVLDMTTPFELIAHFGFVSGRDEDKLCGFDGAERAENGVFYLSEHTNALLCVRVIETHDYGTHTEFIGEVIEARVLNTQPSVSYAYYLEQIKPKPIAEEKPVKGFVCKVCGYVYEGETLPPDFICPLCKHGVEDFEPIG